MIEIEKFIDEIEPEVISCWKHLHQNPELSMKEYNTSRFIEHEILSKTTVNAIRKIGETGLLVAIKGNKPGDGGTMLLRGDMDALPVTEATGLPYASQVDGVMHACGHDVHTSILLAVVRIIDKLKDTFSGTLYCFFQPGEEILAGAKLLLEDKDVPFNEIDGVAALHVSPEIPSGTIGIRRGPILAAPDKLEITIKGKQGHAAHPDTVRDPITAAAQLIMALQTLVSRDTSATDSSVVSFGTIHAGKTSNIIPDKLELTGTVRTINPDTRKMMHERIKAVCEGVSRTTRTEISPTIHTGPPPLISSEEWVARVIRVGTRLLGNDNVIMMERPSMGGEDFAYIVEKKPGVFIRLGTRTPGGDYGSMHSPTYYSDEKSLAVGVKTMVGMVLDYMSVEYIR